MGNATKMQSIWYEESKDVRKAHKKVMLSGRGEDNFGQLDWTA